MFFSPLLAFGGCFYSLTMRPPSHVRRQHKMCKQSFLSLARSPPCSLHIIIIASEHFFYDCVLNSPKKKRVFFCISQCALSSIVRFLFLSLTHSFNSPHTAPTLKHKHMKIFLSFFMLLLRRGKSIILNLCFWFSSLL